MSRYDWPRATRAKGARRGPELSAELADGIGAVVVGGGHDPT